MQEVSFVVLIVLGLFASAQSGFVESRRRLSDDEARIITHRQLLYYKDENGDRGERVTVDPRLRFPNPRLRNAYIALQAWKEAIISDPFNTIGNWFRADDYNYNGLVCSLLEI